MVASIDVDGDWHILSHCVVASHLRLGRCPPYGGGGGWSRSRSPVSAIHHLTSSYKGEPVHWNYAQSGCDWEGTCQTGKMQSPIDLPAFSKAQSQPEKAIVTKYKEGEFEFLHKGKGFGWKALQYEQFPLTIGGETYYLLNFNFHSKAEHTVGGRRGDFEIHFVHQKAGAKDYDDIVIICVIGYESRVKEGEKSDRSSDKVLPANKGEFFKLLMPGGKLPERESKVNFKPSVLFSDRTKYFHYEGSLTTFPCVEKVGWYVLAQPIWKGGQRFDLQKLQSIDGKGNFRALQPWAGRKVTGCRTPNGECNEPPRSGGSCPRTAAAAQTKPPPAAQTKPPPKAADLKTKKEPVGPAPVPETKPDSADSAAAAKPEQAQAIQTQAQASEKSAEKQALENRIKALKLSLSKLRKQPEIGISSAEKISYESHGCDWGGKCSGKTQSPIDLPDFALATESPRLMDSGKETAFEFSVANGAYRWTPVQKKGNSMRVASKTYFLANLDMHSPSEHTINGEQADLEVQFVHTLDGAEDFSDVVVVSLLCYATAKKVNDKTQTKEKGPFFSDLGAPDKKATFVPYDLWTDRELYFHYDGSLTAPACDDTVKWRVLAVPCDLGSSGFSLNAMKQYQKVGNFRHIQPLNNREVLGCKGETCPKPKRAAGEKCPAASKGGAADNQDVAKKPVDKKEAVKKPEGKKEAAKKPEDKKEAAKKADDKKEAAKKADDKKEASKKADDKKEAAKKGDKKEAAKKGGDKKEAAKKSDKKEAAKKADDKKEAAKKGDKKEAAKKADDKKAAAKKSDKKEASKEGDKKEAAKKVEDKKEAAKKDDKKEASKKGADGGKEKAPEKHEKKKKKRKHGLFSSAFRSLKSHLLGHKQKKKKAKPSEEEKDVPNQHAIHVQEVKDEAPSSAEDGKPQKAMKAVETVKSSGKSTPQSSKGKHPPATGVFPGPTGYDKKRGLDEAAYTESEVAIGVKRPDQRGLPAFGSRLFRHYRKYFEDDSEDATPIH